MTELSPAAQAVTDAACTLADLLNREVSQNEMIAAAIEALAEVCVPDDSDGHWVYIPHVLAIAAELRQHS